ncbi:MAG: hypothetical protein JXL97_13245 [Bacteroidales bacterium]|nr:hypothetical protein [Bacteroidales bacterium]
MELEKQTENQEQVPVQKGLNISEMAMDYLYSTAKWAKFLSILGLISLGLIVVVGFSMGTIFGKLGGEYAAIPTTMFGIMYLFMAGIYLYPVLAMLKFANFSKSAYLDNNSENLTEAFRNLKGAYQYVGILTIIGLSLYALGIFVFLIFGLMMI